MSSIICLFAFVCIPCVVTTTININTVFWSGRKMCRTNDVEFSLTNLLSTASIKKMVNLKNCLVIKKNKASSKKFPIS